MTCLVMFLNGVRMYIKRTFIRNLPGIILYVKIQKVENGLYGVVVGVIGHLTVVQPTGLVAHRRHAHTILEFDLQNKIFMVSISSYLKVASVIIYPLQNGFGSVGKT